MLYEVLYEMLPYGKASPMAIMRRVGMMGARPNIPNNNDDDDNTSEPLDPALADWIPLMEVGFFFFFFFFLGGWLLAKSVNPSPRLSSPTPGLWKNPRVLSTMSSLLSRPFSFAAGMLARDAFGATAV